MEASKITSLKVLIIDLCISFVQSASNKQDTAQRGVVPYSVKNNVNGFYGGDCCVSGSYVKHWFKPSLGTKSICKSRRGSSRVMSAGVNLRPAS